MPADLHFDTLAATDGSMRFHAFLLVGLARFIRLRVLGERLRHTLHLIPSCCVAPAPLLSRAAGQNLRFASYPLRCMQGHCLKQRHYGERKSLYNNTLYSNMCVSSLE